MEVKSRHIHRFTSINYKRFCFCTYSEIGQCFNDLSESGDCRAIVLTGAGKHFTAGLDLRESFGNIEKIADLELGRKGLAMNKMIKLYQVFKFEHPHAENSVSIESINIVVLEIGFNIVAGELHETRHCCCARRLHWGRCRFNYIGRHSVLHR